MEGTSEATHSANRDLKGNTREVGTIIGLLSEKIYIGRAFDNFREKQKC